MVINKRAEDFEQSAHLVVKKLKGLRDEDRAKSARWFFKTGKGEYGEGDKFLGVDNPHCRMVAKEHSRLNLKELKKLLWNEYHEVRLTALFILVHKFENGSGTERENIYKFYLGQTKRINNWDLVDSSAYKIVGAYLFDKDRRILEKLARSKKLWERRISIVSTLFFIGKGESETALKISRLLIHDDEDLIHKAVGWILREVGKKCGVEIEEQFLRKNYKMMPRVTLRYAIERFPKSYRENYLRGKI